MSSDAEISEINEDVDVSSDASTDVEEAQVDSEEESSDQQDETTDVVAKKNNNNETQKVHGTFSVAPDASTTSRKPSHSSCFTKTTLNTTNEGRY